jgi:hypothetical protein
MALIETIPVKEDYRRKIAQQLMREGMSSEPILHWAQGLGRLGQAALGGYQMYQADQKDKETEEAGYSGLAAALERFSGGGAPSAQPSPQNPTASPPAPMTSVNPQAGAVPAALMGDRPGGPVMPSAKVWGDKEAEAAGLYEPSTPTKTAALSPMVPTPVKTEAIQPTAAPPVVPTPTAPEMDAAKAKLSQMVAILRDRNVSPQEKKTTAKMAEMLAGNLLQGDKPTDEVREFQYAEKNPAFKQYKMDLKKAGSTNVTTTVGGGSDKQIFDAMDESSKTARQTAVGLTGLREAKQAIEGGAITGFRADDRLSLQKAAAFFGADPTKVANTETFKAAIAPQVAAVLKSTVGTANISNTDREFAEKAAGGNINLDEKSISRLLDIMERASVGQLEAHQKRLDKVYSDPEKFARERALFGVEMPAAPVRPPQAAAPKVNLKQKYGLD